MSPEPWLRGPLDGVDALLAPVVFALLQAREDIDHHTASLNDSQIWAGPCGVTSAGFHLRHIAGSLDRLTTYLEGWQLTEEQLAFLRTEGLPGAAREELVSAACVAIERAIELVRTLDLETLRDARHVGRKRLPTTVMGLAVHLAEHTQRHVGQLITTCNAAKQSRPKAAE